MGFRRGFMFRLLFLTAGCGIVIVGLHFYMYIYKGSSNTNNNSHNPSLQFKSDEPSTDERLSPILIDNVKSHVSVKSSNIREFNKDPRRHLKHKIVHLDLKGMPLLVQAYQQLFFFYKQIGVTGILIEYEDMFPYNGRLKPIANKEAYSTADIHEILEYAKASQLQVIPLVQTFGHLEFVLKLEPFLSLREVPRYPQVICPTNNQSQELVKEMIDQVMHLHLDIKYLHIGSDEVYHIGMCPLCQERMSKFRIDESQLFIQHVKTVAQYVKDRYKVQPIMWDDEFRKLDEKVIRDSGLGNLVEIIVWNYQTDVENRLELSMWEKYSQLFKSVWIGSAFKGADKPNSMTVNESLYFGNHYSWVKTMEEVESLVTFKGIFLTGWQRYDHFSVLCEIMPSAIPSLVACIKYLSTSGQPSFEAIVKNVSSYLDCGARLNLCNFPGSDIHQEILQLELYQLSLKRLQGKNTFLGWADDVNLQLEFSNPSNIESIFQEINTLKMELDRSQLILEKSLQQIYPNWSVTEWMMTKFNPTYKTVNNLRAGLVKILDKRIFPVRPLQFPSSSTTTVSQE